MSGLPGDPTTDVSGNYSAAVDYGWDGTVTPVLAGYSFSPGDRTYTDLAADQTGQDYTAALNTYIVSGTVTAGAIPLANVMMSGLPGNPLTDASGQYAADVDSGWTGTVTPILNDYYFSPPSKVYSNISSSFTGEDYTGNYSPLVAYDYIYWSNWDIGRIWQGKKRRDGSHSGLYYRLYLSDGDYCRQQLYLLVQSKQQHDRPGES